MYMKHISFPCSVRKNGPHDFTLLVASVNKTESIIHEINAEPTSIRLTVEYGDFSAALAKAVAALHEVQSTSCSFTCLISQLLFRPKSTRPMTPRQR